MTLFNTTYLWGLLSLLVPLAIHLLNRGNVKTIKVGSVKFLPNTETKQARNIRLNELLLLLLRALILILLVCILVSPKINTNVKKTSLVYLVEPALLQDDFFDSFLGKLSEDAEIRLFAKGFKALTETESLPTDTPPNYWQLVSDLEEIKADSIVIITRGLVSGLKGARPQTSVNTDWVIFDNEITRDEVLAAQAFKDSLKLLTIRSNSKWTRFEHTYLPQTDAGISIENDSLVFRVQNQRKVPLLSQDTITVGIIYDEDFAREATYFEKAFQVISNFTKTPLTIHSSNDWNQDRGYDFLVWLSIQDAPQTKNSLITYKPDYLEQSLIVNGPIKSSYSLTRRMDFEEVLNGNFITQLLSVLQLNKDFEEIIEGYDQRVMAKKEVMPARMAANSDTGKIDKAALLDVSMWLWVLLVIVMLMERVVAKYRKQ